MATWRKDFSTAVEASTLLHRRGLQHRFELLVGGPDRRQLEGLVTRLGASHVRLRDLTPERAEVARLLRRAWVVCHPALQEDFGNVFLEAAAAGVPVVAVRSPIACEHGVEDGGAGLLVPPRDVEGFADALEAVLVRERSAGALPRLPRKVRYAAWTWAAVAWRLLGFLSSVQLQATPETPATVLREARGA